MIEALIRSILGAKDAAARDPTAILNLAPAMPPVTLDTPVQEARRNYVRLSAAIHPDRVDKSLVTDATTAFQLIVKTFEQFADPSFRRQLAQQAAKEASKKPKKETKPKKESKEEETKTKQAAKVPKPKKAKATQSESDDEESSDDDDEAAPIAVSSGREKIPRSRTNDGCRQTVVACPKCCTPWVPDDPRQYSLFMAYGLRVHCQLCLLLFGCATAIHRTPCCNASFDYDSSMYDSKVTCSKCKKAVGFMYYPVTQGQIDNIRAAELAEERKKAEANERDARAKARGGASNDDEALLELVGQCMVDEQCPICRKPVARKHHEHVAACKANPPAPKKVPKVRKFVLNDQSDDSDDGGKKRKRAAPKKPSALASKKPKSKPKKRARYDSDSD